MHHIISGLERRVVTAETRVKELEARLAGLESVEDDLLIAEGKLGRLQAEAAVMREALMTYTVDDFCRQKLNHCNDMTNTVPDEFCGSCEWCVAKAALQSTTAGADLLEELRLLRAVADCVKLEPHGHISFKSDISNHMRALAIRQSGASPARGREG